MSTIKKKIKMWAPYFQKSNKAKQSRSNDSRVAVQMGLSLICWETVTENKLCNKSIGRW